MSFVRTSLFLVVALILLPIGCKDEDSPTGTGSTGVPSSLAGTWTLRSATVNNQDVPLGTVFQWVEGTDSATIKLEATGAYTYTEYDAGGQPLFTSGGTITVSGSNFTITVTSENGQPLAQTETLSGTWVAAGNTLTLTFASQFGPVVVTATR